MNLKRSNSFTKCSELITITGDDLKSLVQPSKDFIPRIIFKDIIDYIEDTDIKRLLELYGLRRTGKKILMLQAIDYLLSKGVSSDDIIYIECTNNCSAYDLLKFLKSRKYKYIFIDEITKAHDFYVYIASICTVTFGIKTIIAGTDSLYFYLSRSEMYGRYEKLSTTFISYKDWCIINNKNLSILNYIQNAGILGNYYNVDYYLDDAISNNIRDSLDNILPFIRDSYCQKLSGLIEMYPRIVIKITENFNNLFIKEVIKSNYESSLSMGFTNENRLSKSDKKLLNSIIEESLNLNFKNDDIDRDTLKYLEQLLYELDFYKEFDERILYNDNIEKRKRNLQLQPVIRYSQYIKSLDLVESKLNLFGVSRESFNNEYLPKIEGELLEQVILNHASTAYDKRYYDLFTYKEKESGAEIDLVILNKLYGDCILVEIKRSDSLDKRYFRWLSDENVLKNIKYHFNVTTVLKKVILYKGETRSLDKLGVECINIEEFLLNLDKWKVNDGFRENHYFCKN